MPIRKETQKSGISSGDVKYFLEECTNKYDLNIIGLMCLPPNDKSTEKYFEEIKNLKESLLKFHKNHVEELSMGMSSDYIMAIKYGSTCIPISRSALNADDRLK